MLRLQGLIAATFTPMTSDAAIDLARIGPMVDRLFEQGVAGLYVVGSTGEGPSLTSAERRNLATVLVQAAAGRLPVVVQVGHNSLAEAASLAAHAAEIGADAVSATPPSYFRPDSLDDLIACLRQITDAAPELPFYYYHFPARTGVSVDVNALLQRGEELPSLRGVKFTSPRIDEFQSALATAGDRYELLFGFDEMLLAATAVGARGAVGSTYNFAAPLYRRLLAAVERGDFAEAARLQGRSVELVRVFSRRGGLAAQKAIMGLIGNDCGPPRLPLRSISNEEIARLHDDLQAIGFFDGDDFSNFGS